MKTPRTMKTLRQALACALLPAMAGVATADGNWTAPEISPAQVRAQAASDADSIVILDVRTPAEFAAGHVPGAINIPHDEIPTRIAELEPSKGKTIVAYCRSGKRAGIALAALHDAGFAKLMHLIGDMPGWEADKANGK